MIRDPDISTSSTSHFSSLPLFQSDEKWEILSELDSGSSGFYRLYRARKAGRIFALKTLEAEHASSTPHKQLLFKEYQLGMLLNHPGVARTFGMENVPEIGTCIVMEYVNGPTLREYLSTTGTLSQREAETLLARLCEALSYIHACQVVHLDLKPSNIMLLKGSNIIKIIDFGFSDSPLFTKLKAVGSTRKYAAPELDGPVEEIDNRADIYSLGVIMQQMRPRSDRAWFSVAARCCAGDPKERPANAYDIPLILRKARRRLVAMYVTGAAAIGALIVGGSITLTHHPSEKPMELTPVAQATIAEAVPATRTASIIISPDTTPTAIPPLPFYGDTTMLIQPPSEPEVEEPVDKGDSELFENQVYSHALQAAQARWNEHMHKLDTLKHRRTLDLIYVGYWRHLAKEDVAQWLKTKIPKESPAFSQMMQIASQTIKNYGEDLDRKGDESEGLLRVYKRTGMNGWTQAVRQRMPDGRVRLDSLMEDGTYYIRVAYPEEDLKRWKMY